MKQIILFAVVKLGKRALVCLFAIIVDVGNGDLVELCRRIFQLITLLFCPLMPGRLGISSITLPIGTSQLTINEKGDSGRQGTGAVLTVWNQTVAGGLDELIFIFVEKHRLSVVMSGGCAAMTDGRQPAQRRTCCGRQQQAAPQYGQRKYGHPSSSSCWFAIRRNSDAIKLCMDASKLYSRMRTGDARSERKIRKKKA